MARMHARRRGKSCSVRPYRKQAPAWSNMDAKAITKVILDLRKEGASSSKIGLVLRDSYGVEIERSGNDFFSHKTGFTGKSLTRVLTDAGFGHVYIAQNALEICAYAMTRQPDEATQKLLGIAYA